MNLTTQDGTKARLYAGLYLRTRRQTRFWGWGSKGWGQSACHRARAALGRPGGVAAAGACAAGRLARVIAGRVRTR